MSYWLDLNYIGAQPDLMQGAPSTGFAEAFSANLDATLKNFRSNAEASLLSEQYFDQYGRAKQAGIELPENPVPEMGNPNRYAEYDLSIAKARETHPDLGLMTSAEISQRALDIARESRMVTRDLNSRTNVPGFLGEMAGGVVGSMTDPINITTMVLTAPLALTGVGGFLTNIGINMATEAATQAEQRDFLSRQGMTEQELDDQSLQSVLMAGAGTAGIDLLIRGSGRAIGALTRRLRSGNPAEVAEAAGRIADLDGAPQSVRDQARVVESAAEIEATIPKRTRQPEQVAEHIEQHNGVLRSIVQGEPDPVLSRNLEFIELPRTYTGDADLMRQSILSSPDMAPIREEITAALRAGQTETTPAGRQLELALNAVVPPVRGTMADASRLNPEQIAPAVKAKDGSIHFTTEVNQPKQVADQLGFDPRIVDRTGYVVDGQFVTKKSDAVKLQSQAAARERDRASASGPREVPVVRQAMEGPEGITIEQTIARPIGERVPEQERPPRPSVEEQVRNNTEIAEGKYLDSVMEELRSLVERNPAKVLDEESGLTVTDVLREIESDATAIKHIEACILGGGE